MGAYRSRSPTVWPFFFVHSFLRTSFFPREHLVLTLLALAGRNRLEDQLDAPRVLHDASRILKGHKGRGKGGEREEKWEAVFTQRWKHLSMNGLVLACNKVTGLAVFAL